MPRMRGGTTWLHLHFHVEGALAPHARGYNVITIVIKIFSSACPACAGVQRQLALVHHVGHGLPRMRGGTTVARMPTLVFWKLALHARGYNRSDSTLQPSGAAFPACEGYNLCDWWCRTIDYACPAFAGVQPRGGYSGTGASDLPRIRGGTTLPMAALLHSCSACPAFAGVHRTSSHGPVCRPDCPACAGVQQVSRG